jgi:hypothetical protein
MADQLQDIVQRMVAAGESEENIASVIQHYKPTQAQPAAAPPKEPGMVDRMLADNPALPPMLRGTQGVLRTAKANPVQAGAMVGGALATGGASIPAQLGLAALGAAGGAGYGMLAKGAATGDFGTPAGNAATMAGEGAAAATGQGVGAGIAGALKTGGKLVYKTALRPSASLQREFGDVAETGLREGAVVGQRGVSSTTNKLGANGAKTRAMIADAEAAGASPVSTREVADAFGDVFKEGRAQAQLGKVDHRPDVLRRLQTFNQRNPNGIPLSKAQELKGTAQDLASRAYRAEDFGHPITDLSAASDKAMASGLRQGIEKRVPGVAAVNKNSQEQIGLLRALEDATRRNVGIGGLRAMLGDFTPAAASIGGIGMNRAAKAPLPASFRTALISALGGGEN